MTSTLQIQEKVEIRTYKYRWLIVTLFALLYGLTTFQNNQFTTIENVIKSYYGTTHTLVNWTALAFVSTTLTLIIPAVYFFEKFNLKHIILVSAGLTCLGNLLKLLALSPDRFYLVIAAQFICGIAQVSILALPAKVVAVWCSAEEQNRACGFTLWGQAIGATCAGTVPVLLLKDAKTDDDVHFRLSTMLMGNAGFSCVLFIALLIFFRSKPPTPPSVQQSALAYQKTNHKKALTQLWNNKEFLKVISLVTMIIAFPFTVIMNLNALYLDAFPDFKTISVHFREVVRPAVKIIAGEQFRIFISNFGSRSIASIAWRILYLRSIGQPEIICQDQMGDISTISFISTAFGSIVGTFIMGSLLDWCHKYKLLSSGVSICMAISYGIAATLMLLKIRIGAMIGLCIFICCANSAMTLGLQYIAEVSYPVSEFTTLAVLYFTTSIVLVGVGQIVNILVNANYFAAIHITLFAIFIVQFLGTFFLSPKLKRMLVNQNNVEIKK